MLVLEIEFERTLHFNDEGYKSGDDYGLLNHSSDQPTSTQYHQELKPPSTPQIIKNQKHHLSVNSKMRTNGVPTWLSGPQMTSF